MIRGPGSTGVTLERDETHNRYRLVVANDFDRAVGILSNANLDELAALIARLRSERTKR